jgi:glycerol-3-phosphate dehydrogenase (NAD+)
VSLTKGMRVRPDGPQLVSQMITSYLGVSCSVLMGANIAADIGAEQLSEAVIGYTSLADAQLLQKLFGRKYFVVNLTPDVVGGVIGGRWRAHRRGAAPRPAAQRPTPLRRWAPRCAAR